MNRYDKAAARLLEQRLSLTPIEPLPRGHQPVSEQDGYRIQQVLNRLLTDAGMGLVAGHKIGCTTPVMQRFLGIPNPCAGDVFERSVMHRTGSLPYSGFLKLGMECEIAVRLARDIFPQDAPFTRETVAGAVGEVMAAIEIVDDRYRDYRTLGVPTLIADDFFDAGCVLADPVAEWRSIDLAAITGATYINGAQAGFGKGALVMEHPLEALAWLARSRAARGMGLKKDAFILLGSVVETQWLNPGDEVRIEIEELGEASLKVT
jgi:2-keto-4-pentenoate hydratase